MYKDGFVACIVQDGNPVRETQGTCFLPFDSEYSIMLKNKTPYRARADIYIDATKANAQSYIIDANSTIYIRRFNLDGNMDSGRAFKFVSKEKAKEEVDTNNSDFGVVKVEFHTEVYPVTWFSHSTPQYFYSTGEILYNTDIRCAVQVKDNIGGTVQGSKVQQGFINATWNGDTNNSLTTISIRLLGMVNSTAYCHSCGATIQKKWKYCTFCGKNLT